MTALSQFDLADQVIAVTGAGKGIGRGVALRAMESGAKVVACSRTPDDLESLEKEAENLAGTCACIELDLNERGAPQRFVEFGAEAFGHIDHLVNNAGINFLKPAIDYDEDDVDRLYSINLRALYFACTAAAKHMIAEGVKGSIVNVTSQAGVVGAPLRAPYSGLKAGVNNLSRTLAAEWAEHGIRVNALAPTVTDTPLVREGRKHAPKEFLDEVDSRILLGHRIATVDEIALPTLFLLTPAAGMITGQILVVDGGWTIT